MLALTGFLICLFGVVVFTATVRVHAFKRSLKQGLLTFVPFYPWWYGFTQYDRPNKKTVLALTAASIILGCILLIIGMGLGSISKARADSIRMEGMENLRRLCIGAAEFYNNPRMDQTLKFLPQQIGRAHV